MLLALILAASSPTNTVGRFDRTNSRTPQGRSCRGMVGGYCFPCFCASSTNYALRSQEFNNAAWTPQGGASVTASDGTSTYLAPDGTNTAQLLTVTACPGAESNVYQVRNTGAGTVTGSVWVRGSGTISVSIYDVTGGAGAASQCVAGPLWTQCSVTRATVSDTYVTVGCNNSSAYVGNANTGAASVYVWQGQMEIGAGAATCPIVTIGSPVTRSGPCSAVCQ